MKKLFFAISLIAASFVANAQEKQVNPVNEVNPNAPEFKFEKEEHRFGNIKQGESVTYEFKFKNTGKEPLIITNASGSCGCTQPIFPKEPIMKGKEGIIKVTFNSAGKMGAQDKTVTITSNAKTPQKILHIIGNVEAPSPAPTNNGMPVKN